MKQPLIETFHREDPTRPVTTGNDLIAADNGSARLPFLEMLDIVGYTAGKSAAIRLTADRKDIHADAEDIAHIKVEITDENGFVVPGAGNLIQFITEGAGKLAGVDNGNPRDHGSYKINQRNTFNGIALAVVQSVNKPGIITLKATSASLKEASIELRTHKPDRPVKMLQSSGK